MCIFLILEPSAVMSSNILVKFMPESDNTYYTQNLLKGKRHSVPAATVTVDFPNSLVQELHESW